MQTCSQAFKSGAAAPQTCAPRASRRNPGPVRCQQDLPRPVQELARNTLAALTAGLLLGLGLPAEAAKRPPSYYEKREAYEQELKASLDARGARPTVNESPKTLANGEAKFAPLDFSDAKKVTRAATPGLPTPLPARTN